MTTIAASLTEIAADSKCVVGDSHYPVEKVYSFRAALVGVCGEGVAMGMFLDWVREGMPESKPDVQSHQGSFSALLLDKAGLWVFDESFVPDKVCRDFHAIGSGSAVAVAAMMLGKTPTEAVELACQIDVNTGPPVRSYHLKGKR